MTENRTVHGGESRVSRFFMVAAAVVIVVAGLKMAASLVVPFMLSVFIALICSPALIWLKARRVPTVLAILIIVAAILVAGALVSAVVGTSINAFRADIPVYEEKLLVMLADVIAWMAGYGLHLDFAQIKAGFDPGAVMKIAGNTLASLGNMMTNAMMILLTVVFILAEEVRFPEKLLAAREDAGQAREALHRFTASVNRYMGLKTLLSFLTGVAVMLWLWILGVDYPVMWGMLAFLLNFVPNIGSILAAVPAVILALIQLGTFSALLATIGYVVINLVFGNMIEPKVMGRDLNLSPLVVFLSLVFWGWVLGPVGMLLSIPLTIMVKIALESDQQTRWVGVLLGDKRAVLTPDSNNSSRLD